MMKLSHESKVRLGVGIGAFVLIVGLVFGVSRTLIHFDGPWDLDDVVSGLSGMDDALDEDDLLDSGNYSARPQQLSSETFDADAFTSLDLDATSGTVEVKHVSGGPVRVIESGRVATLRQPRTWPKSRVLRSRFASSIAMTSAPLTARLPSNCRAMLPITWWASQRMWDRVI